jgi:hypothetical protein
LEEWGRDELSRAIKVFRNNRKRKERTQMRKIG